MKLHLSAAALAAVLLVCGGPAVAKNAQQERMAACNTEATGKKGDDRKAFMKSCLSEKKKSQQQKMVDCNKDAAGKKGDERKAFMKACLSAG